MKAQFFKAIQAVSEQLQVCESLVLIIDVHEDRPPLSLCSLPSTTTRLPKHGRMLGQMLQTVVAGGHTHNLEE